jgi:hypothetical protein
MNNNNRQDDGRRQMPKRMCPVCTKRTIDCASLFSYHQCELTDYRIAKLNNKKYDYVIVCPNPKCNADLAVTIKLFHSPRYGLVKVPIIGTVIS